MDIKTEKLPNMIVVYFGKPENTTLSIIMTNIQVQFTCESTGHPTNEFLTLWDSSMDLNFYLQAEMDFVTKGINSGIKCIAHAEEFLQNQYKQIYDQLNRSTDENLKNLMIKSLANVKAAISLIKWYKENKEKLDLDVT